jgi:hypothetical protein
MDSLASSHPSVSPVTLDSHSAMSGLLSLLSCFSPQVPCVPGASDLVSDEDVPIPCLDVLSPRQFSDHAASVAASADEDLVLRFPPCLILWDSDDEIIITRPTLSCDPFTLFAFNLPHRLVAVADAFLGISFHTLAVPSPPPTSSTARTDIVQQGCT